MILNGHQFWWTSIKRERFLKVKVSKTFSEFDSNEGEVANLSELTVD